MNDKIIGTSKMKMDEKNRIIIPKCYGISTSDELVISESGYDYYIIDLLSKYESMLNQYSIVGSLPMNEEEERIISEAQNFLYFSEMLGTIDAQNRILLPEEIASQVAGRVILQGNWSNIALFTSEEKFEKFKSRIRSH